MHTTNLSPDVEGRRAAQDAVEAQPWSKPLSTIVMHDFQELHDMVEDSPLVARMRAGEPSRADYMAYLVNVYGDLAVVERHLRAHCDEPRLQCVDFESLYRAEALDQDITKMAAMGTPRPEPPPCTAYHRAYFDAIASHAPYLLVAHAAVRYLGLLFGGQQRRQRLFDYWGETGAYQLYEFSLAPRELIPAILRELDLFHDTLDEFEHARFYNELITAWEFAGDLLENNIRSVSIKYRPTLSMVSMAYAPMLRQDSGPRQNT